MAARRIFTRFLSHSRPLNYRVAIVGTGPAGFYTAHHLLHKSNAIPIEIDFFDRLPAPYGLSRYGVAPDHPEVKNCEEYMNNIMANFSEKVRFFGNVTIGSDISLRQLRDHYHSIVLSYGCTSSDNKLDIPGSTLPGVISARQFVNWYNSHPDSLSNSAHIPPPLDQIEDVTIIGNGNVAIDVARVLLADPQLHWAPTDISLKAVELLSKSTVKRVNIVARRGLLEAAFTNKEIRELIELSKHLKVQFVPVSQEIIDEIKPNAKLLGRVDKRKFSILEKASTTAEEPKKGYKQWALEFLKSPVAFQAHAEDPNLLIATVFAENQLVADSLTKKVSIKTTEGTTTLKNELVILSIGYKGSALEGFEEVGLAFDPRKNSLVNNGGRLLKSQDSSADNHNFAYNHGWYASGWIKHGPQGVIASTMMESFDTADKVLEDLQNGVFNEAPEEDVTKILPKSTVDWQGWTKLNDFELKQGEELNKTRNKVQNIQEMVDIATL